MKKLTEIKKGEKAKVSKILCGHALKQRLSSMGIHSGEMLEVIKNDHGPLIVKVFETKLVIGRGQAEKIVVDLL